MNKLKYILMFGVIGLFNSCDNTENENPISTDQKPVVTIATINTTSETSESNELIVTYDISIDKVINEPIRFIATQVGGSADSNDYMITNGTIAPFENSTQITVKILNDISPEETEDLQIKIEILGSDNSNSWGAEHNHFLVANPTVAQDLSLTINNSPATHFTVQLDWDSDLAGDLDVFVFAPNGDDYSVLGTGDVPELAQLIAADAADGEYLIGIDPYSVEDGTTNFDLNWSFGEGNGDVTFLTQNFDYENRDATYTTKTFIAWGTTTYLMVKVTKTGSDFVVTAY